MLGKWRMGKLCVGMVQRKMKICCWRLQFFLDSLRWWWWIDTVLCMHLRLKAYHMSKKKKGFGAGEVVANSSYIT